MASAALLTSVAAPAIAAKSPGRLAAYVQARSAEIGGRNAQSARLFVDLALEEPGDNAVARRAIVNAIQSGEAGLAVPLARRMKADELGFDGRLLLAVDRLKGGRDAEGLALLHAARTSTETDVLAPLVQAWVDTTAGNDRGIKAMQAVPAENPLSGAADFQRLNMLLTLKRVDEAIPLARQMMTNKDGATRQRIALAAGFVRNGRRDIAAEMLAGDDGPLIKARALLAQRGALPGSFAIDSAVDGLSELLLSLAAELSRNNDGGLPLALSRIAGYASPDSAAPSILTALFLENDGRSNDALAVLRAVKPTDLLAGDALDLEARILSGAGRNAEALARVEATANAADATAEDIGRHADILGEMDRHDAAAAAYQRAIAAANAQGMTKNLWTLHLLRAASLEEVDRWPEAKIELQAAMKLQPDNPVILNYLGYGKLERGEDLDAAEAMIRKASAMRPDDASITDSLGWALYKRGNLPEAIETLRRAAAGDPAQSEIHEHLGDALFKSGRRIEARFAWNAALVTAEDEVKPRLLAKLDTGLNPSNAAP